MVETYKGRKLEKGQLVKVYFNLHKKVFSVKDAKTGLVLAHGNHIQLREPKFEVNERGRQRVLEEKRKNVHAYVVGQLEGIGELDADVKRQYMGLYYNPYEQDKFTVYGTKLDANKQGFSFAVLENKRILAR